VVHHVNVYSVAPPTAGQFLTKQQRDTTAGYSCSGGGVFSGGLDTGLLGSWAPGSNGINFPAGTGIPVQPGSVVVLEMHYNAQSGTGADADQSSLVLSLEDTVEKRAIIGAFWDFLNWGGGQMHIPPNSPDEVFTYELDPGPFVPTYAPWISSSSVNVYLVGLHMHYLGSSGYLMVRNDQGRNECLLEIASWDFSWQMGYQLAEPVNVVLGKDRAYLECHFDNTDANQPTVGGVRQTPRDVFWGEDSLDEMCIGFIYLTEG
jgi:hypothetical protein